MRRLLLPVAVLAALLIAGGARAEEDYPTEKWSFDGVFGTFDRASAQRGFQVYAEVCSSCHSMKQMYYRNLEGIGLSEDQIKAVASTFQVAGSLSDSGQPTERAALPSDHFRSPFANDLAARAANGGALPPDQSLLVNAREGTSDYVDALLQGYEDPPKGVTLQPGQYYNKYMAGHMIAMPPPLAADAVEYADGTKATLAQEASDVTTFLTWAANPEMEARKRMGVKAVLFLTLMSGLTYAVKKKVWKDVH